MPPRTRSPRGGTACFSRGRLQSRMPAGGSGGTSLDASRRSQVRLRRARFSHPRPGLEVLDLGAPTIVDVVQKSVAKRWRLPSHIKQLRHRRHRLDSGGDTADGPHQAGLRRSATPTHEHLLPHPADLLRQRPGPHLGHACTTIMADAMCRYRRLVGDALTTFRSLTCSTP